MARPKQTLSDEEIARIEMWVKEGLTTTWIADDMGISRDRVKEYLSNRADARENTSEFEAVWPEIKKNLKMLRIHFEIAPKTVSR